MQRLHSCGLLRGSFRPEEAVCMLRTLVRDKANLVAERADWLRRMQKSLDQQECESEDIISYLVGSESVCEVMPHTRAITPKAMTATPKA